MQAARKKPDLDGIRVIPVRGPAPSCTPYHRNLGSNRKSNEYRTMRGTGAVAGRAILPAAAFQAAGAQATCPGAVLTTFYSRQQEVLLSPDRKGAVNR